MKAAGQTTGAIEQVDRTWSRVYPVDMGDYNATGEVNEWTYSGDWESLQTYAQEKLSEGGQAMQVTATLRRMAGNQAFLTLRMQGYAAAGGEEEEDGGDDGSGGESDDSSEREISVEVSASMEDILTHPKFAGVSWDASSGVGLQKLAAGADPDEEFEWYGQVYKVGEQAKLITGWELVTKARSYYVPHVVVTVTTPGDGEASVGEIKTSVPGVSTAPGINWLTAGGGTTESGGVKKFVQKYISSGPGGWDKEIYGS